MSRIWGTYHNASSFFMHNNDENCVSAYQYSKKQRNYNNLRIYFGDNIKTVDCFILFGYPVSNLLRGE